MRLGHYGVEAVLKPESFPIDKIYVPVKRRKALKPDVVHEIAESILEIGQQAPILIRPDEDRFVLVEGLHRLEACKALGETTIIGLLVSAEVDAPEDAFTAKRRGRSRTPEDGAIKKTPSRKGGCREISGFFRRRHGDGISRRVCQNSRNGLMTTTRQSGRGTSGSKPKTLSEWRAQQERNNGQY